MRDRRETGRVRVRRETGRVRDRRKGGSSAHLEVNTLALVRDDEVWVNRALGSASRLRGALTWQRVSFQPRLHREVGDNRSTAAALDGEAGGFCPHS